MFWIWTKSLGSLERLRVTWKEMFRWVYQNKHIVVLWWYFFFSIIRVHNKWGKRLHIKDQHLKMVQEIDQNFLLRNQIISLNWNMTVYIENTVGSCKVQHSDWILFKKNEAKRNKQLNAIIEMVTMSEKDSLALRQENDMTDDKGSNLLKGIDIWRVRCT